MAEDSVQPSSCAKATGLAIAARVCGYFDHDGKGVRQHVTKDNAKERAEAIASVAKILLDAVEKP